MQIKEVRLGKPGTGWRDFAIIMAVLSGLRIGLHAIRLPSGLLLFVINTLMTIVFLMLPVIAVYRAMSTHPTLKQVIALLVTGVFSHGLLIFLRVQLFSKSPVGAYLDAIAPIFLLLWCVGLGALLTSLIREPNILIPIALFLIAFDIFLVLSPIGPTQAMVRNAPQVLREIGYTIPKVATAGEAPVRFRAAINSIVGPADFVFLGTFFLALFKFKLNATTTLRVMIPVLALYMLAVIVFQINLPALVPIGIVTLATNLKHFRLSKDEWAATGIVALFMLFLLGFAWAQGSKRQASPVGPLPAASAPTAPKPAGLPEQGR